jgi:hypothetical protein
MTCIKVILNVPARRCQLAFDFHVRGQNLTVRRALPENVSRHTVKFRERVKRRERDVFHQNAARLMQNRDALFLIAGALFLVDELVEFRIVVVDALGAAGAKGRRQ